MGGLNAGRFWETHKGRDRELMEGTWERQQLVNSPTLGVITKLNLAGFISLSLEQGWVNVWPIGCLQPVKSFGLKLARQLQAGLRIH